MIKELAHQLKIAAKLDYAAVINGRTTERYRAEIRARFGFREATVIDAQALTDWLCDYAMPEKKGDRLIEIFETRCHELAIVPPTLEHIKQIVRAAIYAYDEKLHAHVYTRLSPFTRTQLDDLLKPNDAINTGEEVTAVIIHLRDKPGRPALASILSELKRLELIHKIDLLHDLFDQVAPQLLERYKRRVEVEAPFELRRHPEQLRFTLLAAFVHLRRRSLIDSLVDLFD